MAATPIEEVQAAVEGMITDLTAPSVAIVVAALALGLVPFGARFLLRLFHIGGRG